MTRLKEPSTQPAAMPLEEGLVFWSRVAEAHRVTGHHQAAELIETMCAWFASATENYRRWLSERDALLRSGRGKKWLRSQFPAWEAMGLAKREGKERLYRMVAVPTRGPLQSAFEAGQSAGKWQAA